MSRYRLAMFSALIALAGEAVATDGVRVLVEAVPSTQTSTSPFSANALSGFPADVDFRLEALYPARRNEARAKIELLYSCVSDSTGGRIVPCHITIDNPVARENSGGHVAHQGERPTGRHIPSAGWVSESDGYLRSTYYASEVGGVVDVTIHCDTGFMFCRDGTVVFGVGLSTLEDLGPGAGYTLTGAKPQHPSNHWGVPAFLSAARRVASQFANDNPNNPLLYNEVSLEYGGVFDVATRNAAGYDWTPPHSSHRLGTNMDIGIPQGNARRALLLRLYQMAGVGVLQEDQYHWHLSY